MKCVIAVLIVATACALALDESPKRVFVGYFGGWTEFGGKGCTIQPLSIPPNQFTHIIYAFTSFTSRGNLVAKSNDTRTFTDLITLRNNDPNLKILTSLGGGSVKGSTWSQVMKNSVSRNAMVKSIVKFCRQYKLDGVDIDWEFPQKGEKDIAITFFADLRKEIDREGKNNPKGSLLFTSASPPYVGQFSDYPPEILQKYVDFFNVMFYDYHGAWNNVTGANTALYGPGLFNINATLTQYLQRGTSPQKLVFGFANYGRTLTVTGENGMGKPAKGGGQEGFCVHHKGVLVAPELDMVIKTSNFKENWDDVSKTPFGTYGKNFVTYDNDRSVDEKMKLLKEKGLRGAMLWQIHASTRVSGYIAKTLQSD
eukprot:TRINITY_DN15136_c0_g1_i1.p1 TRINITY_DN15136_c0_g1~~TRINITY_DN15136_c0_g1_i1.p1  ORF type:complete len:368 (-),score=96.32 TRINITY_DN15136_c0_g1_i1:88-1191(-)